FFVYSKIGGIGHSLEVFDVITKASVRTPFGLLMALLFTILPISINYVLMALYIVVQFSANYEVAAIVGIVLLLVLCFYGVLGGKEKVLILFTIIGFYFKVPYLVPLIAGLYFGAQSIIPISIGVFLWEFYPVAFNLISVDRPKIGSILDVPESFGQILSYFMDAVKSNNNWIVTAFVFSLVTLVVYAASKMDFDYSKEIAIAMGTVVNIISFIFVKLAIGYNTGILSLILLSILSGVIAVIIKFFDIALNYQRAERVEFEDDDNYYFVKVVPKIALSKKERSIKRIRQPKAERPRPNRADDYIDDEEELDEFDDYLYSNDDYDSGYDDEYDDYDDEDSYNK
ncbi:hypothetical protein LJB89_02555, partial [Tyzzerella sp. OttesenSCG-928-J15]|nr:hypothetical protein [Tyzzerella sp. OttesenSCG-928-J15]